MKLTKYQFCIAVETYQAMIEENRDITNILNINEWYPSNWIENYYELLTDLSELEADPIVGTDLDWFCFDANFGENTDCNKIFDTETGLTWRIESPEILYDYITRD